MRYDVHNGLPLQQAPQPSAKLTIHCRPYQGTSPLIPHPVALALLANNWFI